MKQFLYVLVLMPVLSACESSPNPEVSAEVEDAAVADVVVADVVLDTPGSSDDAVSDEPSKDVVRRVVAQFFNAAINGDRVTLARLSLPNTAVAEQSVRARQELKGAAPDRIWMAVDRALVATLPIVVRQPTGPEVGYLVITLHYSTSDGWQIADIDFEDDAGLNDELARFVEAAASR